MEEETYSTDGPTCPYCSHVSNPSEEPSCYDENNDEWTCESCGEDYQLEVYTRHSWIGKRRDRMTIEHPNDDRDEGDLCRVDGCTGRIQLSEPENCSCHISAPCSACTGTYLYCDGANCDWTNEDGQ